MAGTKVIEQRLAKVSNGGTAAGGGSVDNLTMTKTADNGMGDITTNHRLMSAAAAVVATTTVAAMTEGGKGNGGSGDCEDQRTQQRPWLLLVAKECC